MKNAVNTKLRRDDQIQVVQGREKGKTGRVLRVDRTKGKVIVQGINMVKKAVKPKRQDEKGGIIDIEAPIDISNVQVMCKKCGPSRIGIREEKGKKERICKKCGDTL
ncbi:MAG: 50S ribosomal protein L24 [Spirochaetia bacterium]